MRSVQTFIVVVVRDRRRIVVVLGEILVRVDPDVGIVVRRASPRGKQNRPAGDVEEGKKNAHEIEPVPAFAPVRAEPERGDLQEGFEQKHDEEEHLYFVSQFRDVQRLVPGSRRDDHGGGDERGEHDFLKLFVRRDFVGQTPQRVFWKRHFLLLAHPQHRLAHLPPLLLRLGKVQRRRLAQRSYPRKLVEDDAHVQVEQTKRAQNDKRQKKRKRRWIRVSPRLFVDVRRVQAVEQ